MGFIWILYIDAGFLLGTSQDKDEDGDTGADLSTTCLERSVKKEDYRSDGVVTNTRNLLIWWPMVIHHPFSFLLDFVAGRD